MIRVRQVLIPINKDNIEFIKYKVADKLRIDKNDILDIIINKKSIDARKKPNIFYVYEIDVKLKNENIKFTNDVIKTPVEEYKFNITGTNKVNNIVVVGSGPAGLFATYMLATNGYKVTLIERGECVENRINTVDEFWKNNKLNINSNVQFGEGGAGTFSDGKLNTMVKDPFYRGKKVFEIFVENGADPSIMYLNKPHIGTDKLVDIVKNMRNVILNNNCNIRYNTCLTDIVINDNKLDSIIVNNNETIKCDALILAIGHSARDTFKMLYEKDIIMQPKPFAVGVRVQHPQDMINISQYGKSNLPNADYKLTYQVNNRGVYSFCMCPGGYVVNASSEENRLAINGMSYNKRDSINANSAIVVTVNPSDFGTSPLDGLEFQKKLETKAYKIGKGLIPVQLLIDYKNNVKTDKLGQVKPLFKGNYTLANLNEIFPDYINDSLKKGFDYFDKKIKGFNRNDAILSGVESRTSSPVRILRDDNLESNIKGIYPIGEGAGYAGGITSSAMDGLKVAEKLASIYLNN